MSANGLSWAGKGQSQEVLGKVGNETGGKAANSRCSDKQNTGVGKWDSIPQLTSGCLPRTHLPDIPPPMSERAEIFILQLLFMLVPVCPR